jgi:hypothetical protein
VESNHQFVRPGQVAPDRPAPDRCMQCGRTEAEHLLGAAELLKIRTEVQAGSARSLAGSARDCLAETWTEPHSRIGSLTYFTRTLANELERALEREQEWVRAATPDASGQLAAIRAVLARVLDDECADRQYALEEIERITDGAK